MTTMAEKPKFVPGENVSPHRDKEIPSQFMDMREAPIPAAAELTRDHERMLLDYDKLVAGNHEITLFGENHYHTAVMDSIARNAHVLRQAGIRAFMLEAGSSQDFSRLNGGDFSELDADKLNIGPDLRLMSPKKYERVGRDEIAIARIDMIKALVRQGIIVIPVDSSAYHEEIRAYRNGLPPSETPVTREQREEEMANNIDQVVDRYGKTAGLIGKSHARRGVLIDAYGKPFIETAQYAIDHGHSVRTVHFFGSEFYEGDARKPISSLVDGGWGQQTYMYHPEPGDRLANGAPDWIAYIPPNKFEFEYAPARLNSAPDNERM